MPATLALWDPATSVRGHLNLRGRPRMNLALSVIYSSFPRKRKSRDPRTQAVAPCSSQGQALDPRFRVAKAGVTVPIAKTRAIFGRTLT
jgi:hypothetical protein